MGTDAGSWSSKVNSILSALVVSRARDAICSRSFLVHWGLGRNGQAVDTQKVADTRDHKVRPPSVYNDCEDKISSQVPQFELRGDGAKEGGSSNREIRMIYKKRSANHWCQHDRPVGEWLPSKMGEDDFGCHPSKYQRHSNAIQHEMVVLQDMGVWRPEPCHGAGYEDNQRGPFIEQRRNRKILGSSCACNIDNASWKMRHEERNQDNRYPQVSERDIVKVDFV